MAVALVQTALSADPGVTNSVTCLFGSSTTTGNLIVVAIMKFNKVDDLVSVTDGQSNTYTLIDKLAGGSNGILYIYYAKNITGGASPGVTVVFTGSYTSPMITAHEISGANTSTPLDVHAINNQVSPGTGANAITSTSVTTTTNGQYVFGATNNTNLASSTAGTGFTGDTTVNTSVTKGGTEHLIQSSAGSVAATWTQSGDIGGETQAAIATFKAAAAAAHAPFFYTNLVGAGASV